MNKSAAFTAAAMLVAGISFASAQTTAPSSDSGKCWDAASNVVRDKMPTTGAAAATGSSTATTDSKAASGSAGSAPTTGMAPAPTAPAAGTTAVRPAGLQNC
jgi:hypothetical protein